MTEFVKTLRTELEATFKEDVSIYFDENPHDGLEGRRRLILKQIEEDAGKPFGLEELLTKPE